MKKITFIVILLLIWRLQKSHAQIEVNLSGAIELPLDEMYWVYNPAQSAQISVSKLDKYKNRRSSWGINLGYSIAKPKQEIFYFPYSVDNDIEFGTISYSDMQSLQISSNYRFDYILTKSIEFFMGVEAGFHYIVSSYDSRSYNSISATNIGGRGVVSPKTGFTFMLNDKIGLFLQTRYNVSIIANGEADDSNFFYFFWSNGAGITLRF